LVSDGSSISNGKYLQSVGSGSCDTSATASTLYVASSSSALSSLVSSGSGSSGSGSSGSSSGSGSAVSSGSGGACTGIANGTQCPASCPPYASSSPWNGALPDSARSSGSVPSGLFDGGNVGFSQVWTANTGSNAGAPVYFASSGDPRVSAVCTLWCASG